MLTRRLRTLAATALCVTFGLPTAATALTWTDGNTCTVTPRNPVQVSTSVAGRFDISCTKYSTVAIEVSVGEWDHVVRNGVLAPYLSIPKSSTVALPPTVVYYTPPKANSTFTVLTPYRPCWNTEIDNEEYGTRIRVMTDLSIFTKGWSRTQTTTAPSVNANTFGC
ncbi:MAG: hypothetical protein RLZ04_2011 [Actinomycetota bacterium]|jgi:hypothetical protein